VKSRIAALLAAFMTPAGKVTDLAGLRNALNDLFHEVFNEIKADVYAERGE
jgi:hypothetical protein